MDIDVLLNGYHWVYNYTMLYLFCHPFSSVFHIYIMDPGDPWWAVGGWFPLAFGVWWFKELWWFLVVCGIEILKLICNNIHTYMSTYMYVYILIYVYTHICIYIYIFTYVHIYIYIYFYLFLFGVFCWCVYVDIHVLYIYIYLFKEIQWSLSAEPIPKHQPKAPDHQWLNQWQKVYHVRGEPGMLFCWPIPFFYSAQVAQLAHPSSHDQHAPPRWNTSIATRAWHVWAPLWRLLRLDDLRRWGMWEPQWVWAMCAVLRGSKLSCMV